MFTIMKPMKPLMMLLFVGTFLYSEDLTQQEQWQTVIALHQAHPLPMPMAAEPSLFVVLLDFPLAGTFGGLEDIAFAKLSPPLSDREQFEVEWQRLLESGRVVDADQFSYVKPAPLRAAGPSLVVGSVARLASFQKPMRLAAPQAVGIAAVPSGTTVTFSSQGDAALKALTGKGLTDFQVIAATICRWTPGPSFSFGLVTQLANSIGIQTVSKDTGTAIVQQKVAKNWHNLAPKLGAFALATAVGLTVGGVIPASIAWQRGFTFGHLFVDSLPALLGPTSPNPDPYLRNSAEVTDELNPEAGKCVGSQFSGVYAGPKSSFVTDRLQLLP